VRTTLDIADDVLGAAKELARRDKKSAGEVISELARRGLKVSSTGETQGRVEEFFGFRPFPSRGGVVTNAIIDQLREEDGE
jgi:hypothetical protein